MKGQYESNVHVSQGVKISEMIGNLNKQIMKNPLPGLLQSYNPESIFHSKYKKPLTVIWNFIL